MNVAIDMEIDFVARSAIRETQKITFLIVQYQSVLDVQWTHLCRFGLVPIEQSITSYHESCHSADYLRVYRINQAVTVLH